MEQQKINLHWKIILLITIILSIIILVLNFVIFQSLYKMGLQFTLAYQNNQNKNLTNFYNFISFIGDTEFTFGVVGFLYLFSKRNLNIFILLSYAAINLELSSILKAIFIQPRPYWIYSQIKLLEDCSKTMGNPSGHCWGTVVMYQLMVTDIVGSGFYKLSYLLVITLSILMPISRLYLGVHSVNQILLGLTSGLIMIVLYRYRIQKWLYDLFETVQKNKKLWYLFIIIPIHIIIFLIPIGLLFLNIQRGYNQDYLQNMRVKCGQKSSITLYKLFARSMPQFSLINFLFGFLYGLYFISKQDLLYLYGRWKFVYISKFEYVLKFILHIFVKILIGGIPIYIFSILISFFIEDKLIKYGLHSVGMVISGALLISLLSKLGEKLQIFEQDRQTLQINQVKNEIY